MKSQKNAGVRWKQNPIGSGFEFLEDRIVLSSMSVLDTDALMLSDAAKASSPIGSVAEENTAVAGMPSPDLTAQAITENKTVDKSDNTYRTAKDLGRLAGIKKIQDYVGRGDRKDIYEFRLTQPTSVRVKLHNLEADAELRLLDGNKDLIKWSLQAGAKDEFIRADLEPGTYFIRVDAFDGQQSGDYDLRIVPVDLRPDAGGNDLDNPTDLGELDEDNDIRIAGWVGNGDKFDYYQFYVDQFVNMRAILSQLTGNGDLHLYDVNRNLLGSSSNPGKTTERLTNDISPGIYIFGVEMIGGSIDYQLTVSADPAEFDERLPNVDYYGTVSRDRNVNSVYAPEAWTAGHTGDDVVVAIIDSGVDYNHRDLKNQMWKNSQEIAGDGIDNDENGYVDDVHGWDFTADDNKPLDENGHGTHVAGIVAAAQNSYGATGIAHDAKIMPVRVLDDAGDGDFSQLARGIYYAVDNGADIVNLSIGGEYNYSVRAAIAYANANGVLVVAATGNGGLEQPLYPARHSAAMSNVISVGAHNTNDARAWFSNYVGESGAIQVDAPGVNVYSTLPNNGYGRYSGTSSSAPFVSGLAAMVLSVNAEFSPSLVRHFIVEGAIRDISGSDSVGGIDAARTLYLAQNYGGNAGGSGFGGSNDGSEAFLNQNNSGGISKQNFFFGDQFDKSRIASIQWRRVDSSEFDLDRSISGLDLAFVESQVTTSSNDFAFGFEPSSVSAEPSELEFSSQFGSTEDLGSDEIGLEEVLNMLANQNLKVMG